MDGKEIIVTCHVHIMLLVGLTIPSFGEVCNGKGRGQGRVQG